MGQILRSDFLKSDLAAAEALHASMADNDVHLLDRLGLEFRMEEIRAELAELQKPRGRPAEAVLYFYGEPVVDDRGIDAKFSADVLAAYQDLISKQVAAQRGSLARSGPIRAERETHLHITNVVHGSFGFELEEVPSDDLVFDSTPLGDAIDRVTPLINSAKESDEAFADHVADTDERVYSSLQRFIGVIHKSHAAFRLVTPTGEITFDELAVNAANDRVSAERTESADEPVVGTFQGLLRDARRFEHRTSATGDVIRGKVADGVEIDKLAIWYGKVCTAHVRVVTLTRGARVQRSYTLLSIAETATTDSAAASGQ